MQTSTAGPLQPMGDGLDESQGAAGRGGFCRYRRRSARGAVMSEDKGRRLGIGAVAVLSSCLIVDSFGQ